LIWIIVVAPFVLPSAFGGVCALRREQMNRLIAASGTSFCAAKQTALRSHTLAKKGLP
jgi:hypothetical protein